MITEVKYSGLADFIFTFPPVIAAAAVADYKPLNKLAQKYKKESGTPKIALQKTIDILADSVKNFSLFCVKGIKANKKKINENLNNSLMLVTALAPHIGYDKAAMIAKKALKNNTNLKHEAVKSGLVSKKEYEKIVNPSKMIKPS